jgi:hypothetical protein
MPYCLRCGRRQETHQQICPDCRQADELMPASAAISSDSRPNEFSSVDEFGESRVAIARFQSGAEAGYFADELIRRTGMETDVLTRERFDAVHAVWTVDYLLLVSRDHADEAPRLLQELVDATGDDDGDEAAPAAGSSDLPAGVWVPLIITLAAGSIVCFGIERADHRPRPAALVVGDGRKPPELWEILGATQGPWVQQLDEAGGVRRLTLDREHRTALLQEDDDGDGVIDREWEFSWQPQ